YPRSSRIVLDKSEVFHQDFLALWGVSDALYTCARECPRWILCSCAWRAMKAPANGMSLDPAPSPCWRNAACGGALACQHRGEHRIARGFTIPEPLPVGEHLRPRLGIEMWSFSCIASINSFLRRE